MLAVGEREHERDHRGLEQGGADLGKSRPSRAIGVQVDAGEHQHGDQVGERDPVARLLPDDREREVVPLERELDRQRGNQRTGDADEVEDQQREDAGDASQRLELQQEREDGGRLRLTSRSGTGMPTGPGWWVPLARVPVASWWSIVTLSECGSSHSPYPVVTVS